MTITFDRPVGCNCDVNELEYISALHQTAIPLREDGSIVGKSWITNEVCCEPCVDTYYDASHCAIALS